IPAPDEIKYETTTQFVYDKETGEIVYSHRHSTIAGTKAKTSRQSEATLRKEAAALCGQSATRLAVLTVPNSDKLKGAIERVDVAKAELITTQAPGRIARP
ncbi:MAG TPA: hypothetical protein VGC89_22995, partial [Pyrinomonadaceae bacterium]